MGTRSFSNPKKIIGFVFAFLTTIALVYSARQPVVEADNNEWGTILNAYLNMSFDINGSLKNQTFNVTDSYIFLKEVSNLVGLGIAAPLAKLHIQDSSDKGAFLITNSSGTTLFYINGSSGKIAMGNTTNPVDTLTIIGSVSTFGSLNATAINATQILTSALTSDNIIVNKNIFIIGNVSNTNLVNLNVNASIFPTVDASFDLGNGSLRWRNANFSGVLEAGSATAATIRATNLQDLDSSNFFDYSGFTSSTTCGQPDQTGAVACSAISITESQISDLGVYEWRSTAFNYANNLSFNNTLINQYNDSWVRTKISNNTPCTSIIGGSDGDFCADATGGGGNGVSFSQINVTANFSHFTNAPYLTVPNLTLKLPSSGVAFIECVLYGWAAAAGTGIQIQANVTGSSQTTTRILYPSTATAIGLCGGDTNSTTCAATGSGGLNSVIQLWTTTYRMGVGESTISVKSELASTPINITEGSWCRYTALT